MNRRGLGCLLEVLETIVLTLVIFLVIQTFVAQPYQVEQQSMEPTLEPGQYVLVDKLSPRFSDYKRGDVVVFSPPKDAAQDGSNTPFIKRVIGVAGDTISIHDGSVYVNGKALAEPYVFDAQPTESTTGTTQTWNIADGSLFVLGDHRENSQDSRSFGPIEKSSVLGRAWVRYWPLDKFGTIPGGSTATPAPGSSPASPTVKPSGSGQTSDAPAGLASLIVLPLAAGSAFGSRRIR